MLYVDNFSEASGGGIQNSGDMTIVNTTVSGNLAYGNSGGGIANIGSAR